MSDYYQQFRYKGHLYRLDTRAYAERYGLEYQKFISKWLPPGECGFRETWSPVDIPKELKMVANAYTDAYANHLTLQEFVDKLFGNRGYA